METWTGAIYEKRDRNTNFNHFPILKDWHTNAPVTMAAF